MKKLVNDLVKGDVVLPWFTGGPTLTVRNARTYVDTVVVWWADTKRPTTFSNNDSVDVTGPDGPAPTL